MSVLSTLVLFGSLAGLSPTPMTKRAIPASAPLPPGRVIEVKVDGRTGVLFVPPSWKASGRDEKLRIHVHTAVWYAVQEHVASGMKEPLLVMDFGAGSVTYSKPFESPSAFPRWMEAVAFALDLGRGSKIGSVQVASFSAGYGAVREWMKQPGTRSMIRRLLMCDSFYGGILPGSTTRAPEPEHVSVWAPFAKLAMEKRCTFVITNSRIQPTTYLGTYEVANELVMTLRGRMIPASNELAATAPDYPLLERFDKGFFHVWNYAGTDAPAHTVHIRHIPKTWQALDVLGAP